MPRHPGLVPGQAAASRRRREQAETYSVPRHKAGVTILLTSL